MSERDYKLYIQDILNSIEKIIEYTKSMSSEEFSNNDMTIDAVVRNFEIIGEASKNVPENVTSLHANIPWREMAGMRDKMIHEYFGVDLDILWKTIKTRLPELKLLLENIDMS